MHVESRYGDYNQADCRHPNGYWPDYTAAFTEPYLGLEGMWRDTVFVPPYGSVTIRMCFDAGDHDFDGIFRTFAGCD